MSHKQYDSQSTNTLISNQLVCLNHNSYVESYCYAKEIPIGVNNVEQRGATLWNDYEICVLIKHLTCTLTCTILDPDMDADFSLSLVLRPVFDGFGPSVSGWSRFVEDFCASVLYSPTANEQQS